MTYDIVARLRDCTCVPHGEICREAADEIERLRAVVEAWLKYSQRAERDIETLRAERDEARRERNGYLEGNRQTLAALAEANEIAKRYKAERDEARRLFCKLDAEMYRHFGDYDRLVVHRASYLPSDAAKKRGWDCFKEER